MCCIFLSNKSKQDGRISNFDFVVEVFQRQLMPRPMSTNSDHNKLYHLSKPYSTLTSDISFQVGGFQAIWKYYSTWIISPSRDKTFKKWNHHLETLWNFPCPPAGFTSWIPASAKILLTFSVPLSSLGNFKWLSIHLPLCHRNRKGESSPVVTGKIPWQNPPPFLWIPGV